MHHEPVRSQRQPPVSLARLGTRRLCKPTDGHFGASMQRKVETKTPLLCCSKFNRKLQQQTLQGSVSFIYRLMDHNFRCVLHSDRSERLITLIHHNVTVVGVLIRSIAQLHLIISTDLALKTSKPSKSKSGHCKNFACKTNHLRRFMVIP